jgi:hypothetical protein
VEVQLPDGFTIQQKSLSADGRIDTGRCTRIYIPLRIARPEATSNEASRSKV